MDVEESAEEQLEKELEESLDETSVSKSPVIFVPFVIKVVSASASSTLNPDSSTILSDRKRCQMQRKNQKRIS